MLTSPSLQSTGSPTLALARVVAVAVALLVPGVASATRVRAVAGVDAETTPKEMEGVRIDDKAGTQLPADVHFKDQNGREVVLGDYFDGSRPVVLVMAYYTCPMLCTIVLNGVTNALREVAWNAGEAYRIVTISIDPRDTAELATQKRANYMKSYGRMIKADGWDFLTGDEANVKRLADAMGFHYKWDPVQEQYAHAAGAFVLTPKGVISRVFFGIAFNPADMKLALIEASGGRFASAIDQLLLLCFHYDPKAGKYVIAAQRVMTGGGVLMVIAVGMLLAFYFKQESKRAHA
jgi:protein SCO1/2